MSPTAGARSAYTVRNLTNRGADSDAAHRNCSLTLPEDYSNRHPNNFFLTKKNQIPETNCMSAPRLFWDHQKWDVSCKGTTFCEPFRTEYLGVEEGQGHFL